MSTRAAIIRTVFNVDNNFDEIRIMNKYELKYCLEDESTKVKDLIDINGKNAHHIQDLYEEIKELKIHNKKLIVRMNDKTEENIKLKNIIRSQQEKNLAEYHFPESVDN